MAQRMTQFYEFGRFTLDVQECRLLRDGLRVPLKPKVFETLILLVENSGHMMDKDELMKRLWRSGHALAKPSSLAVLPFRNLKPNAETDFIGLSMADAITTRLSGATALSVRPSAYADNYRNQSMDPRKAAEELNADELLT